MATRRRPRRATTPSPDEPELPDADELERLKLSPEVAWYLVTRGIPLPDCPPAWKTPEAGEVLADARFDPERVDKVLGAFGHLRHTKGKWAGQSLRPDPWQVAYVLAPAFGWVQRNEHGVWVRVVTQLFVDVPRKNGKGLDVETPTLTADGWRRFGDLKVGEQVHTVDGSLTRVAAAHPVRELDCYRVTFGDGQSLVCDADHRWTVWDRHGHDPDAWQDRRAKGAWVTVDTPTLHQTHRYGARGDTRYSVRTDRIAHRPAVDDLLLDPYLLGAWLGDGATDQARLTTVDPELVDAFRRAGFGVRQLSETPTWSVTGGLRTALRELGVLGGKDVPEAYLLAGDEQRLALLQGLMDTDGGVTRGPNTPRVEFTSTRRCLAEAVLFLARSLGWKARMREGRAMLDGRDCGPKWRVTWTAYADRAPFTLPRKVALLAPAPDHPTRASTNTIVAVESVATRPTRCITVEHESGQFLAGPGLVPTHNSTLSGGVSIYLACADGEAGAEVIVAATGLRQAGYVFDPVKTLAKNSPALRAHVKPLNRKIVHRSSGSYIECVAAVADAMHGGNIHGGVVDELHLHRDAELVEAIESGTGSREQPLITFITTADDGQTTTPYARKRDRVEKLAERVIIHASTFGVIWSADDADDPFVESTWRKANPGAGISPSIRYLRDAAEEAREDPAKLAGFLRLHLGIRTGLAARFIPLDAWDRNAGLVDPVKQLRGRPCYGGLDLATTSDLTAFGLVFPDEDGEGYDCLWRHWIPERAFKALDERTSGQAKVWRRQGLLTVTPGDVTDYAFVRRDINADRELYDVRGIGYDRWNSSQVCVELENDDGAPMVKIGQGFASLSAPTKALKHELLAGHDGHDGRPGPRFRHGGQALMRWQATNLRVEEDAAGNVKPSKKTSMDKIDGFSATVDALSLALANESRGRSIYEDDDLEVG